MLDLYRIGDNLLYCIDICIGSCTVLFNRARIKGFPMATNPSFQVEDQTDEDFFDKLVNDDDDMGFKPSGPVTNGFGADGSDSDEAKAFANLSLGDEGVSDVVKVEQSLGDVNVEEIGVLEKKSNSSSGSVIEHSGVELAGEQNLGSVSGKSNDSPGGGVKEVQWTAFGANTGEDGNEFGSYSNFFNELSDGTVKQPQKVEDHSIGSGTDELQSNYNENAFDLMHYQGNVNAEVATAEQSYDGQAQHNIEYWESQYPGWKFDANTGQWYQVNGYDTAANELVQGSASYADTTQAGDWVVSDGNSQISYLQQGSQSVVGAVTDSGTTESVSHLNQSLHESVTHESLSNWTEVSQQSSGLENVSNWDQFTTGNNGYPEHMVFDPQYPGWYYDAIALEWRLLESYTSSVQSTGQAHGMIQSTAQAHEQARENVYGSNVASSLENMQTNVGDYDQLDNYNSQSSNTQNQDFNSVGSFNSFNQQGYNMWQPEKVAQSGASCDSIGNQVNNSYCTDVSMTNHVNQQKSYDARELVPSYENVNQGRNDFRKNGSQSFVPAMTFNQPVNQAFVPQNQQKNVSNDYYGDQNSFNSSSPQFQSSRQFSQAPDAGRSSAGRPPHALVTFGFGGKLIVMKDDNSLSASSYRTQGSLGGTVSVFNLMEVVMERGDPLSMGAGGSDYFTSLCKRSLPGPLAGGNVGTKELNKWIDEKISSFDTLSVDYKTAEVLKLLFALLKISFQYYGKLRSPFGTEAALRENDAPESAVARLFASVKGNGVEFNNYNVLAHCLQKLPSEEQIRANAAEVQKLLVSGRKKEALEFATDGQLWGPALVLAAQLGDQYYCETVKQMALRQLVAGSPLRTLCLLIAGQPADVFSSDCSASSVPGSANIFQQSTQHGIDSMLDHWEENLAVITANRTKDDELVLVHLGDSLWKNRSDIIAAHICYLVAEANFELYSDSARLCLIGADHWKSPRTYASPDAIQRTELYEYSKVIGNSQFVLLPFQPYKLIYALMLAEVGKVTESLKYCQAVLKSLKTGRAPEVDTLRQLVSSFEERLKTHQQGGYSSNLAPAKIVGKLLNLFDSTAHRVVGGLPPPIPSTSQSSAQVNEQYYQTMPRVSTSQSTMAMSSLMPSASTEPISEWTGEGNRMSLHNRSVSEPDIGRTPRQGDSSKESNTQGKASVAVGMSRFGRFGFGSQLLQKTVGLLKPRQDKQAKLGDTNKFYYDEKLKRWVEEGAEPPAEEAAPPPPPTTAAFQNGTSDYSLKNALKSEGPLSNGSPEYRSPTSDHSSGIPPIPTASNQFSARGRMGVRSRYVDTFNKGGNSGSLFQSPAVPSMKPVAGTNPKFFVPSPVSPAEHSHEVTEDIAQQATSASEMSFPSPPPSMGMQRFPSNNTSIGEMPSIPAGNGSFASPPPSVTMQRFPSMDNITRKERAVHASGLISSTSRRTASWSGSLNDASNTLNRAEVKPLGEVLGTPPSPFMPNDPSIAPLTSSNGSFGEDLHEVEL